MRPEARTSGVLLRELPGELLVYNEQTHAAHCLNRTAALVFRACDGARTVDDIASLVAPLASPEARDAVELALEQLRAAGLLTAESAAPHVQPAPEGGLTRRDMARRVGLAAAILLPAVATMVAPTPAEAAATCVSSCVGQPNGTRCDVCNSGAFCSTSTESCVNGTCSDGCAG
jgi:hypothetical protein